MRKSLAVLVATAIALPIGLATAPQASAATQCSNITIYQWSIYEYHRPTTAFGTGDGNCLLDYGSTGQGVTWLQIAMWRCYGQQIDIDGKYGSDTKAAVKNVQTFHKIKADGVFGPVTNLHMAYPKYIGTVYAGHCWG